MPTGKVSDFPIVIFADGACSGNPGPGGWGSIVVTPQGEVTELGGGLSETTNNQMELMAVIRALERIREVPGEVEIYTDSVYVIKGITQWIWGWRKNGWKSAEGKEVANQEYWKALSAVLADRGRKFPGGAGSAFPKAKVEWKWVRGHSGVPGNERVDAIAVAYTKGYSARLYQGPLMGYGIAIHDIPDNTDVPELKPRTEVKAAAHSYLSLVGGTPMRHRSWAECERRVKGQSGAKFKKAMSPSEEMSILSGWGYQAKDIKE
jgi:ribonuclease HI